MSSTIATLYFVITAPVLFYIIFTDLRYMRIYNGSNIVLFLLFLIPAPFFFAVPEIGWRLLAGVIAFAIGFLLNIAGRLGGGDAKFLPAATPFIATGDIPFVLVMLAFFGIVTIIVHRGLLFVPPFRAAVSDWVSWNHPKMNGKPAMPYGVALALTLSVYLFLRAFIA